MFELLDLTVRILAYAIIGLIPLIYNYYFVKGKVEDIRRAYLTKLKKYEPIMPLVEAEIHGEKFVSTLNGNFKTTIKTPTQTFTSSRVEVNSNFEPIVITSNVITPNLQTPTQESRTEYPYVVLVLDPQIVRNPEAMRDIVTKVENVLPGWQGRFNGNYQVEKEV